jgi:hypothetical protein
MTCEKNWKQPYNLKGYIDCLVAKRVVDPSIIAFSKRVTVSCLLGPLAMDLKGIDKTKAK